MKIFTELEMDTERSPQWDYHETKQNQNKKQASIESAKMTAYTNSFNDSQWVFSLRFTFDLMPLFLLPHSSSSASSFRYLMIWTFFFFHPKHVHRMLCIRTFSAVVYGGTNCASKLNHLLCVCTVFIVCAARERTWILCKQCFSTISIENSFSFGPVCILTVWSDWYGQKVLILLLTVDIIRVARLFNSKLPMFTRFCSYYSVIASKFCCFYLSIQFRSYNSRLLLYLFGFFVCSSFNSSVVYYCGKQNVDETSMKTNCYDDSETIWPHIQFDRVAITCCFPFDGFHQPVSIFHSTAWCSFFSLRLL